MASFLYYGLGEHLGDGTIDVDNDTFNIVLLDSGYSPDRSHATYADISAHELGNGNGYAVGGQALQNVTWSRNDDVSTMDADDPVWTGATFDAAYAAIYDATSANDVLVSLIDFGGTKSVSTGTFTVQLSTDGIFTVGD